MIFNPAISDTNRNAVNIVIGTSAAGWTKKDCDYLCDGVDDQVEIQTAVDKSNIVAGMDQVEIVLLPGVYNISNTISIKSSYALAEGVFVLRGSGKVVFNMDGLEPKNSTATPCIELKYEPSNTAKPSRALIQNICFERNQEIPSSGVTNYAIKGYWAIPVDDVRLPKNAWEISDCTFKNIPCAIADAYCVKQCLFIVDKGTAVHGVTNCASVVLCSFTGSFINAIYNANIAAFNTIKSIPYSIIRNDCGINSIISIGNIIKGFSKGIKPPAGTRVPSSSVISGNCIVESGVGIQLEGVNDTVVSNNTIKDFTEIGIDITTSGSPNCSRNHVSDNIVIRGTGLNTDYSSTQYTIYAHKGTTAGAGVVEKNYISNNMTFGKAYTNNAGSTNTFSNNRVS